MTAPWIDLFNGTTVTVPKESTLRRHRWHLLGRLGLLTGLGLGGLQLGAPTMYLTLPLGALALVAFLGLRFGLIRRAALLNRFYPPFDMVLLALLIRETGGAGSPLTNLGYLWFFGMMICLRQGQTRLLPLLAALPVVAVALGSWGTGGWPLGLGAHTLGLGVAAFLGRYLLDERSQSRVDPLTRAAQRRYGSEQLSARIAAGVPFSVAFLDLHGFKEVNDRYGHGVGDELLCAVAARLGGTTRAGDLVMRYGGDEFVVASSAPGLSRRLVHALAQPVATTAGELPVCADIGEASWQPGESLASLLARADASMYAHKAAARALKTSPLESGAHPSGDPHPFAQLAGSA